MLRRTVLTTLALLATGAAAFAQAYPSKPVKIIVPFGPGGPADVYARAIGQHLGEAFGQPFVVENKPGAGAVIGTKEAANAAPDGYTLLMMSNTHTANETLLTKRGYELMKAFVPVAPVNSSDLVIMVHPSVPAKTLKEFVDLAKKDPDKLVYASSGTGTPYHLAGENFKAMTGTKITHLPHRNSGDARNSVIGGHATMMMDAVTSSAPTVKGGVVRALATTGKTRTSILPDVPTAAEAGVPGFEATIWLGLMAPAGTPQEVVNKLNAEVVKFQKRADIKAAWDKQGAAAMMMSPADFGKFLVGDIAKWKGVIEAANIKAQ